MIERPHYLAWLERWKRKNLIKVIVGMRRCGKSTLLEMYQSNLRKNGVADGNILSINFESLDEEYPKKAVDLYRYVVERLAVEGVTYVFLDEIQHVEEFEKAVDGLFIRDDVDLYITGSNAYYLSGELATLLTGRYVELQMFPLSFSEYSHALEKVRNENGLGYPHGYPHGYTAPVLSREQAFERYITYGGLPFAVGLESDQVMSEYLNGVYNTILVKDIARRHPQMNLALFESTASFLADNNGNPSSTNSIANCLAQQNKKVSRGTVDEHIEALIENYLLFKVQKHNLKGKELLKTNERKYYLGDLSFRFWLLGKSAGDIGHRIENVVYLELLRRYDRVAIGSRNGKEIDFIASNSQETHYYQVSQTVLDERVLERELSPLRSIDDNYPKTLLTLDSIGVGSHAGINQVNLLDWLLEG